MSKEQQEEILDQDITVDDEQIEEGVEVSTEETTSEDIAEGSTEADKEVNGEKANDETVASVKKSASKQATAPKTKAGLVNAAYQKMSQMTKEELTALYDTLVSEDTEEETSDEVVEEQQVELQVDFQEDLNALVSEDESLSEDFKDKAAIIFEAAVKSKISEEINRLEEQYEAELAEEVESIKTGLAEKVDGYLSYVVEQWMEENKVAVEVGLRAEIAESFIQGLKNVFEQHYVDVPESKYDLVDDLATKVNELEEQLTKSTEDNIKLTESVSELRRAQIISEATEGMVELDAAKLKSLVEDVDYESEDTFAKKVGVIKESYFKAQKPNTIDESVEVATNEKGEFIAEDSVMSRYVTALTRTTK